MSERDIKRWQDTITPRDKAPQPWTIGSGGSWDMMEVQPIPDAMLAELAQRYQYAGTPWNCRSMPLSESDREYMYMLYYGMQGLVARLRLAEKERDFAKTEIARLHDDIRELTDVRVLDEEDRDLVAWLQGTSAKPAPSFADAYQGAMEEVAIWKKRALEAEDLNRKFIAEINGPMHMGEPAPSVPGCPYPCGWRNLLKLAIEDGAYLARSINEDEPVTENARAVTMRIVMQLRNVLMAINAAAPKPESKP